MSEQSIDFNEIMVRRFAERGWEVVRKGDVWNLTATGQEQRFRLFPPGHVMENVTITVSVDISGMWHKDLIFPKSNPIGGCGYMIDFGDLVEAECRGVTVDRLPLHHYDPEYDEQYLSPLHLELSKFTREVIREGKNRLWNLADPYGRMQPSIGWPGHTVPWFKTNPDGTVMTDEHGGLISNGALESMAEGLRR